MKNCKRLIITGCRGLPSHYSGYEYFAEHLSVFLNKNGWEVIVYCQTNKSKKFVTYWNGIKCININTLSFSNISTVFFDFVSILHSLTFKRSIYLTLGYNTAIFNTIYLNFNKKNIINMDGIEWKKEEWSLPVKAWFYANEKIAKIISTMMIADHPEILKYLSTNKFFEKKINKCIIQC